MNLLKGCKRIYYHYGKKNQIMKLAEEAAELQEASLIYSEMSSQFALDHLNEEMADVLVVMTQLIQAGVLNRNQIKKIMVSKIERQIRRMENES